MVDDRKLQVETKFIYLIRQLSILPLQQDQEFLCEVQPLN